MIIHTGDDAMTRVRPACLSDVLQDERRFGWFHRDYVFVLARLYTTEWRRRGYAQTP